MPKSLLWTRLEEFFENNPDEELHYRDLETKFFAARGTVRNVVPRMKEAGLIEVTYVVRKASNASRQAKRCRGSGSDTKLGVKA